MQARSLIFADDRKRVLRLIDSAPIVLSRPHTAAIDPHQSRPGEPCHMCRYRLKEVAMTKIGMLLVAATPSATPGTALGETRKQAADELFWGPMGMM